MVSDSELIERLRGFLNSSDLNTTTTAIVRRRLEEDFGIDLSDRKAFIREQVDIFIQSQFENAVENSTKEESDGGAEVVVEEEEEEESPDEESGDGKSSTKKRSRKKKKEVKKRGGGFSKLCSLSPQLQKFTGVSELARTEVVKQLWIYIKQNNLQDQSNRRNIICDDTLQGVFGVSTINMFEMNKALSKHIWPLHSDGASASSMTKEKQQKQEREDEDDPKRKEKRQKCRNSAFLAPLALSDALTKFLGTGESALPRSDVIKRLWDYIKQNNLQDPSDKRQVICDEKLKELFDVEAFHGFTVAKLLTAHFIKTEQ